MSARKSGDKNLAPDVVRELRATLPTVAAEAMVAVTNEVAEYRAGAIGAETVQTIQGAIEVALAGFVDIASTSDEREVSGPHRGAIDGAYALGRGEARTGRTMEALLAAYRVGARVAWHEQSSIMVRHRVPAPTIAEMAELSFSYIDELSSVSASGHRDELESSGRVREQLRERLARALLDGESEEQLGRRAELAGWPIPESVTVVTAAAAHVGQIVRLVDPLTLRLPGELAPGLDADNATVLILPNIGDGRAALMGVLHGRSAVVGPTRNWPGAERSYSRVLRALTSLPTPAVAPLDTNDYLMELTLTADEDALFDLRRRMLAPLDDLRPSTALRLAETLRSWLLHLGRRGAVAADLHVHPQTVRYRMSQIEALFGERLRNPDEVLALTIALAQSVDTQDHS